MSSILKALKKLESETAPRNVFKPWPEKIDTRKVVSKRLKKNRRLSWLLYAMVAITFFGGGVWLFFGEQSFLPKKFSTADMPPKTKNTISDIALLAERKTREAVDQSLSKAKNFSLEQTTKSSKKQSAADLFQEKMPDQPSIANFQSNKNTTEISSLPPAKRHPPSDTEDAIQSGPTEDNPISNKTMIVPDSSKALQVPSKNQNIFKADLPPSLTKIENSGLKVQAIAWFKDSKRRIAVINGRILREGENIDGYSVVQIGQDDVIVRKGDNEFKIVFR